MLFSLESKFLCCRDYYFDQKAGSSVRILILKANPLGVVLNMIIYIFLKQNIKLSNGLLPYVLFQSCVNKQSGIKLAYSVFWIRIRGRLESGSGSCKMTRIQSVPTIQLSLQVFNCWLLMSPVRHVTTVLF
jgi:hypothetical protein